MKTLLTPNSRVQVPPDVLVQDLQGEAVLLNVASGCYFGLDAVGHRMWQALVQTATVEEACQQLVAEYDAPAERVSQDLQELLGKLVDHGLLEVRAI